MLGNARAAATLPAVDLSRARKFYEGTLGLRVKEVSEAGIRFECGGGTMIFVYQRGPTKADNTAVVFDVEDFDKEMRELKRKGVRFEEYDLPGLKTVNGVAEMDGMKTAWFKDSEGNILAVGARITEKVKA